TISAARLVPGFERQSVGESAVQVETRLAINSVVAIGGEQAGIDCRERADRGPSRAAVKRVRAGQVGVDRSYGNAEERATVHVENVIDLSRWRCEINQARYQGAHWAAGWAGIFAHGGQNRAFREVENRGVVDRDPRHRFAARHRNGNAIT